MFPGFLKGNYLLVPSKREILCKFHWNSDNEKESLSVKVLNQGEEIRYIKKVHYKVFHKPGGERLKLSVKALDENGIIKRVFLKVYQD